MRSFCLNILKAIFISVLTSRLLVNSSRTKTHNVEGEVSAYKPGDIILGGLFPARSSQQGTCGDLDVENIALVEAMIFTVNKVNKESLLPWNLTLGYDIRNTCNLVSVALKKTLHLLSEKRYSIKDGDMTRCGMNGQPTCGGKLISVIGAGRTEISVAVNKVLGAFEIPQIGYASISGVLSDKTRFPSFSRTVVPGSHVPKVMSNVMTRFGWTYVALLTSNSPHWRFLSLTFKNLAHAKGICVGVEDVVPYNTSGKEMESIINRIQSREKLKIILLFTSPLDTNNIIIGADAVNMTGKIWVASEVLAGSIGIMREHERVAQGMLVISRKLESVAEFSKYFENLTPKQSKKNPWLWKLVEKVFGCSSKNCKGTGKLKAISGMMSFSHVNYVIDAVMAVCHVIKRICREANGINATHRKVNCLSQLTKPKVLSEMFLGPFVFQSLSNRTVILDSNGDAVSSYKIQNFQTNGMDARLRTIGMYTDNILKIKKESIQWPNKSIKQPYGKCNLPCSMGNYRIHQGSKCCWKCVKCPLGFISKDALKCTKCQHGFTSNENRTSCRKNTLIFFGWDTGGASAVITVSVICFGLSLLVLAIFLKYNTTPIVSGLGSKTNFRLLWSITFGVLVPFAYIGYPTDNMCKMQTLLFGSSVTLSVSLVLAKAKQVTCKRKNLKSKWHIRTHEQNQVLFSMYLTIVELLICILWIINKPPVAQIKNISRGESIVVCTNTTSPWYALSTFPILVISIACTYLCYNSRKRLANYSETKYILYAMVAFYSVWIIFTSVLYGTPGGIQDVTINCLAIIATQMMFLGFIFIPKLFIIFFKSKLNKEAIFNALIAADDEAECACANSAQKTAAGEHPAQGSHLSPSISLREVSSREFPSHLSLESKTYRPSFLNKLPVLPCCPCLMSYRSSTADSSADSRDNVSSRQFPPYPLPIISIEEGQRTPAIDSGDFPRRGLDTNYPTDRCTCEMSSANHEYQAENIVSLTAGGRHTVWNKQNRRASTTGKRRSRCDEGACEMTEGQRTMFVKGTNTEEDIPLGNSQITNEHNCICESRL